MRKRDKETMDIIGILLLFGVQIYFGESRSVSASEERIVVCRPRELDAYSQDPNTFHEGSCPNTPAPDEVPNGACHKCECWSDTNCDKHKKCCYNGCKNTCMESVVVAPAPVIDWLAEPPRQRTAGNAWLISGPEEPYAAETCSTTFFDDGGDPLQCPTGYICYIEDEGDAEHGIPNIGICIRE
ncbi:WAP four-disulfide core domain protein 1 [Holothuria leucospilota]|uniref:WAP four-disulfide core domain protein 1 n=1 Tax=Holothuria leucospilota TaxID=206669 RepID=A0A9Q1BDN2_HOLLE|nr:WAP four-disulfide core domain protein 1 [Holothuria leucospilota]